MGLLDDVNKFIATETAKKVQLKEGTREKVLNQCRLAEAQQFLPALNFEPTNRDIEEIRTRLEELTSNPGYCGKHNYILYLFDSDPDAYAKL